MKIILSSLLSFFFLTTYLFGQSSKPLGVILPPTVMGNVSESRTQILLNTLDDELSKNFDVSPSSQSQAGKLEVVRNIFQLQIIEEDGDTQLSLRWIEGNNRKVETDVCSECKTIELNEKLVSLVEMIFRRNVVKKSYEKSQEEYIGTLIYYDGSTYVGKLKDGKRNG